MGVMARIDSLCQEVPPVAAVEEAVARCSADVVIYRSGEWGAVSACREGREAMLFVLSRAFTALSIGDEYAHVEGVFAVRQFDAVLAALVDFGWDVAVFEASVLCDPVAVLALVESSAG